MNEGDGKLRRRAKAWKWALGVFGGIVLVFGLIVWDAHRRVSSVFERHAREVAEKIAAIRSRPTQRPSIYSEAQPGNAWEHYSLALDALGRIPEVDSNVLPEMSPTHIEKPDDSRVGPILSKHAVIAEEVGRALRREQVDPGHAYEEPSWVTARPLGPVIRSAKFMAARAAFEYRAGRDREALESVVAGLGMAHDLARQGALLQALVMFVCEGILLEKGRETLAAHALSAGDLERFAGMMDLLAGTRPRMSDFWQAEDVLIRDAIVRADRDGKLHEYREGLSVRPVPGPSWRFLFSRRVAAAGALGALSHMMEEQVGIDRLPTHRRRDAGKELVRRLLGDEMQSDNPFVNLVVMPIGRVYQVENEQLLAWTLLRVATAISWHEAEQGRPPEALRDLVPRFIAKVPECPYSGLPLGYRVGKLWSPGGDGKDDGGAPLSREGDIDSDGDVVWTVKPRGR